MDIDIVLHFLFQIPANAQQWLEVSRDFENRWNLPHCLGAIDGKHVTFRPPLKCGSYFFNYKNTHSLILFALVDADYKFLMIDVGTNGRVGDGGVFAKSDLNKAIVDGSINFPDAEPLKYCTAPIPYFLVGDDAFPLQTCIMKPYPFRNLDINKRIFNYRLSRARRVVENAFGILANRFRVLLAPMLLSPDKVEKVVLATCAIHNYLRTRSPARYFPPSSMDREDTNIGHVTDGDWREVRKSELAYEAIASQAGNRSTNAAQAQRDYLCSYVNNIGRVSWQDKFAS